MANEEHLAILQRGVDVWNAWREKNPDIIPNLRGVDLSGADLQGANLSKANLAFANLKGANITGANIEDANLLAVDI